MSFLTLETKKQLKTVKQSFILNNPQTSSIVALILQPVKHEKPYKLFVTVHYKSNLKLMQWFHTMNLQAIYRNNQQFTTQ